MNPFDVSIIHFLNSFAERSKTLDSIIVAMTGNVLLQGGIIVVLFWWAWVPADSEKNNKQRNSLLFGIFASIFSVLVARLLALTLPFRLRPIHNPLLGFKPPYSMDPSTLIGWSSFPSDHSVVFFCLAMSLWFVSKRLGGLALVYALLGASLPRVYAGIHYPTDIVGGAVLGIGIAYLGKVDRLRDFVGHFFLHWQELHPASFTAFLFLVSFELAEEFDSLRHLGIFSYHGLETLKIALR